MLRPKTCSHFHMLTVVILYPQNKVSAGVADRFHWYARILLDWCLGEQLPCRTGGKTTGEINSKHWTIYPFIDLFLELMYPIYHWASDGLCWENNSWLLWAALLWCNWVWCNRVLKFSLPETLSSSLMYATLPLAVILIRPDQSGFSSFQSAAL